MTALHRTLLGIVLLTAAAPVFAEACRPNETNHAADLWTASATLENDLFVGTDKHYTNGVSISLLSPDLTDYRDNPALPEWAHQVIDHLPFINEPCLQRNIEFSLAQKIFTPENIRARNLIRDDRPYAGWLYLGAAFHNKNPRRLDTMALQIGMVGPAALGEAAQNNVHKIRDIDRAKGWDNQLENELGLVAYYERKWRAAERYGAQRRFGADLIPHVGGAVGNVATYISTGTEARIGWNLPADFGTSLIRPGGDSNAPADNSDPRVGSRWGFYLFSGVTGRLVGRDIFLDGNTFEDSHSVDRKLLVGDAFTGVSALYGGFKMSYAQVWRSKEFDGQDDASSFGSVTLSYSFR